MVGCVGARSVGYSEKDRLKGMTKLPGYEHSRGVYFAWLASTYL
jgi:hypothetical protein